jgi:hypothetical protein
MLFPTGPLLQPCIQTTFPPPPVPVIMEEIDNIIDDVFTPICATAAAQGLNVAHASVQLSDSLCNHWQTDLNRFVACDYLLFRTESFAKKGNWKLSFKHLERIICLVFHQKLLFLICRENSRHLMTSCR